MTPRKLSLHVLQALAAAQSEGTNSTLDTLVSAVQVRRGDVRMAVTALHQQGYLDALRMRLTLRGFAIGSALLGRELTGLRLTEDARAPRQVSAA